MLPLLSSFLSLKTVISKNWTTLSSSQNARHNLNSSLKKAFDDSDDINIISAAQPFPKILSGTEGADRGVGRIRLLKNTEKTRQNRTESYIKGRFVLVLGKRKKISL